MADFYVIQKYELDLDHSKYLSLGRLPYRYLTEEQALQKVAILDSSVYFYKVVKETPNV